jgi:FAD/FMN-containing dehydrogenase
MEVPMALDSPPLPKPGATTGFFDALRRVVGPASLVTDPDELLAWGRDWTRVHTPAPCAAVLPHSTAEIVEIVNVCKQFGVPIVPSGGRTGLAAGAVARHGELVLSLARMTHIEPVDTLGQSVRVQAGATNQAVQEACAPFGLQWPVDLASKGSSHIGGNLSTNAGGLKVIRHGHARHWVLGLQVVTAQGEVLEVGGALEKDNTGLDLRQLFIGSEGTLGIIAAATLKLTRRPGHVAVLLCGLDDLPGVLRLFEAVRRTGPGTLQAFEMFTAFCLDRVVAHRKIAPPLKNPHACYALLELETTPGADLDAWLVGLLDQGLIRDGTLAQDPQQARQLWTYREAITESLAAHQPHKNDIALPVAGLAAFVRDLEDGWHARRQDWPVALFGHVGDGNLHLNTLQPEGMAREEFLRLAAVADAELFALVQRHGGSISAEHGIGLVKKPYLQFSRSAPELAVMRAVKRALDPENLLNPGKIFDL